MAQAREYSEATAQQIDAEVRLILDAAHDEAYKALMTNRKVLDAMAKELMERETLQAEDIAKIFKPVKKLPKRAQWLSKKTRPVSKQGPIAIPDKGSNAARARVAKATAAAEAKAEAQKPAAKKPVVKKTAAKKPAAKTTAKKTSAKK
jgi:cell division protease FtsH